jgi:hypothetical protein
MKYAKLFLLFFALQTVQINSMDRLLTNRYDARRCEHRSNRVVVIPKKESMRVKIQMSPVLDIPAELCPILQNKILTIPFLLSRCFSLDEAGKLLCNLAATNCYLNNVINDRENTLEYIKQLSQEFRDSNIDVARKLCTREASQRYVLQVGFFLNGWNFSSPERKITANKLKRLGLDTNFSDAKYYPSPLYQSCYNNEIGNLMAAEWLLENGADPNIHFPEDKQNVVMVFLKRNANVAMLVGPNAGVVGIKQSLTTSLLCNLISHPGLNLDHQDSANNTLLHYCLLNYLSVIIHTIRLLLERGANPTIKNNDGKTPLDLAREKKDENIIRLLEQAEIDYKKREK